MVRKVKPGAVSRLGKQRAAQMTKIYLQQRKLEDQLKALVPENLRQWLKVKGRTLFIDLVKYGEVYHSFCQDEDDNSLYDFIELKEFADRFAGLRKAWKGVVKIQTHWGGPRIFKVFFSAL